MSTIEARVEDLTHDGSGVVKVEEKVYFVDGALPGELVEFQPEKKRKGKHTGKLLKVLTSSEDRVEPECEYFGVCGGCVMQHLSENAQLHYKEKILFDNLSRLGKVEPVNRMPMITGSTKHYRRKARLGVKFVPKKGGILVGFRERKSSFITSLDKCLTLDRGVSDLLPDLHHLISGMSNNNRIPQIEIASGDEDLSMIIRHMEPLNENDESLLTNFSRVNNINVYSQSAGLNSIKPIFPLSPEPLSYSLPDFDLTLNFSPYDFIQVNSDLNNKMVAKAVELLELKGSDRVLDLFCGLGNFTLAIAKSAGNVLGVEGDQNLVRQGAENAVQNNIPNAQFDKYDLYGEGIASQQFGQDINKILLDPPRSGALQVVTQLIPKLRPEKIVYVSCNPATLARDADELVNNNGYLLTHAGAIDMFPHTAHVESIAVFERKF